MSNIKMVRGVPILLVVVLAAGAGFFLLRKKPVMVDWIQMRQQDALETVLANGRVAGRKISPLALLKGGIVREIPVEEGAGVRKGDTLVILDNREEANLVAQRTAEYSIARINLEKLTTAEINQAEEELNRARILEAADSRQRGRSDTLYQQGSVTRSQLDDAVTTQAVRTSQRAVAEAHVEALRTTEMQLRTAELTKSRLLLENAAIALSRSVLFAPADGRVIDITVEKGEFAASGTGVLLFLPADSMVTVEVQVDENEVGRISTGQRALVGTYASSREYEAEVKGVVGRIDADRGTATVLLSIRSDEITLIADQTVSAQIITGRLSDAYVIEQRFCIAAPDGNFVFVKQGNRVHRRAVERTDIGNARCVISNGLSDRDTVVMAPGLVDNTLITLRSK